MRHKDLIFWRNSAKKWGKQNVDHYKKTQCGPLHPTILRKDTGGNRTRDLPKLFQLSKPLGNRTLDELQHSWNFGKWPFLVIYGAFIVILWKLITFDPRMRFKIWLMRWKANKEPNSYIKINVSKISI